MNMQRFILLLVILLSLSLPNKAAESDSLSFEILLNSRMLTESHLDMDLVPHVAISPIGYIILSNATQLYALGNEGMVTIGNKTSGTISSFAFTKEGALMIVRNDEVCTFDSTGNFRRVYLFPKMGMEIASGDRVMYLFDKGSKKSPYPIYVMAEGGKYTKLFELPNPINCLVEMNHYLFFSSEDKLYRYYPKTGQLSLVVIIPEKKKISSLAADPINERLYLSVDSTLFTVKGESMTLVSNHVSGELSYSEKGLLIFNPKQQLLIRISGLEQKLSMVTNDQKIISEVKKTTSVITNSTISYLTNQKVSPDVIIHLINTSEVNFELSVESMISLSESGVSSQVIKAMKNARKK
jgi:hypothetical protein